MAKIILYEAGTSGLKQYSGFIEEAYHRELRWPSVQPLFSRLRRSDPEIAAVRAVFTSLARSVSFRWETPNDPTEGDLLAQEFAESVLDDIDGGMSGFLETLVSQVPFMGWGWWEVLPGYRSLTWTAPDGDGWRSQYDDGRVGIRRLAWRDSSSFWSWKFDDFGRMNGMIQLAFPNPQVTIPLADSLHIVFGDAHNPEGLSPLEAVWRLERIKYGLEVIQGIGFEHSAGYLDVQSTKALTPSDNAAIKAAARSIMSAQEGNYAAWPDGVSGELKDVNFAAAASLLEAIKYFGILKLTLFNMQWVALSAQTGAGSFASMADSSSMFLQTYNAMLQGFARQMDQQIGKRLFQWNSFPGMTRRPHLTLTPVNKLSLTELAAILGPIKNTMPLGDDDYIAIRKQSGFLPESLPESTSVVPPPATDAPSGNTDDLDQAPAEDTVSESDLAMQRHYIEFIKRNPDAARR